MGLKSDFIIPLIKEKMAAADPNPANRKVHAVYQINVTDGGKMVKQYVMDLKTLKFSEGSHASPEVTMTVDDATWADITNKKISPKDAKEAGKLKLDGDAKFIEMLHELTMKLGGID